jgi:hypothetical protein
MGRMLAPEVEEEIVAAVRGGFDDRARIVESFCEERYEPGELDRQAVTAAVDRAIAAREAEKTRWPAVTDCDRITAAFTRLNARGVIALENAGFTQSDGYDDVSQAYDEHADRARVLGYCYYHGQDLERAVAGGGLWLSFGPVDPDDEETVGPRVGALVREELERAGLEVAWDGSFSKRIHVPKVVWQRR